MRGNLVLFVVGSAWLCASSGPSSAWAETIVSQRLNATRRLLPPKKITVGPNDQYNGSVFGSGTLVFTHKSDLVPHLVRQDLASGEATDLLPLTADSQESAVGFEGRVAFTYYRSNARGDICWAKLSDAPKGQPIPDEKIHCVKADASEAQSERSSPFWRGPQELGFVVRDISTHASRIVTENILTGARTVLAQGKVWSPAMNSGGRFLVYSALGVTPYADRRVLVLKDLASGQERPLVFALPGISGFPSLSEDEKFLYFSHYLDDTNHDNVIDGSDNSVVFRAPIDRLLAIPAGQEFFPEQLTSFESNCSFPHASGDSVYVSCALEGSLDIYRIAATGIVPADWTAQILDNAHQTARTYAERILLLNTMRYRTTQKTGALPAFDERLLGNHLLDDDATAARYYVARMEASVEGERKDFYRLLSLYLEAREKKKSQPSAEVSRDFQGKILAIDSNVQAIRGHSRFQKIVRGMLRAFLERPQEALSFLKQVGFASPSLPMERYLGFELAAWTIPKTRAESAVVAAMTEAYSQMARASELVEESQLFYAFNLLKYLQQEAGSEDDGALDPKELDRRIGVIKRLNSGMPAAVDTLLQSETVVLEVIRAQDEAIKTKTFAPLEQLMSKSRGDYFLRRALYVRAILNFAEAGEFKYIDAVASAWLRYTAMGDTEFIHAREFFATEELDHAYESAGKKNLLLASNYFYGALSLTDDLESHAGYLRAMVAQNQRVTIDERYKNLVNRQFIDDNLKFVEALLLLIDSETRAKADPTYVGHVEGAIKRLSSMSQDRDSPVRYLLLGYCQLEKILRTSDGLEVDPELLKDAHRSLMLGYDLGRDNDRVKAAVLMNLGLLHQRAQNHGLAARFFALRKNLGFIDSAEAGAFAFLYARSLFYTHEPEKAAEELANAPGNVPQSYLGPLLEREAFYRVNAGQYDRANKLYSRLLKLNTVSGPASLAKVSLNYGLALLKTSQPKEAAVVLRQALEHASKLASISKGRSRLVDFEPVRIRLAAYGLLARTGSDESRLDALEKRAALLPEAKKLFDTSYLPTEIQNRLASASILSHSADQLPAAREKLKQALQFAEELGDSDLGYLSNAIYRAATQYLSHAWLHPKLYAREDQARLRKVIYKCISAYESQKGGQPLLAYQKLKLQLLWGGYSSKVLKAPALEGLKDWDVVAGTDPAKSVQAVLPGQWKELTKLRIQLF